MVAASAVSASSPICCCSTMLYTLAFSNVNTRLVFLSRVLSPSKISADGFSAKEPSMSESYKNQSAMSVFDVVSN